MDLDLLAYAVDEREYALQQLHYWLRYEGMVPLIGASAFVVPYGIVLFVVVALAFAFTPYMLWQLWRARWIGTLVVFAVFVITPFAASRLIQIESPVTVFLLTYGPLVVFYFFTWVLRFVIGERLSESRMERLAENERERLAL